MVTYFHGFSKHEYIGYKWNSVSGAGQDPRLLPWLHSFLKVSVNMNKWNSVGAFWSGPTPFYHGYVLSLLKASRCFSIVGVTLSEQLHCVDLRHSTQTMNSSRVYDCHLPVRTTMAAHTWTKLTPKSWAESLECSLYMALTWSDLSHRCISSVSCLLWNVIVHSWELIINTLSCVLHLESSLLLGFFHANGALWQ